MFQNTIPNKSWLINEENSNLRKKSQLVKLPLSNKDQEILFKLIDYVDLSQDKIKNKEKFIRPAVGIAAVQINSLKQMFYIRIKGKKEKIKKFAFINPLIIAKSSKLTALDDGEGCLSVKTQREGYVKRYYKIIIKGYEYFLKKEIKTTFKGYIAIVFQHELDHLNGILYFDHINKKDPWKKDDNVLYI